MKKSLKLQFFQNAQRPQGFLGWLMLKRMNRHHRRLHRWGLSLISLSPTDTVLDVGCGGGALMSLLLKKVPLGSVEGLDPSLHSVRMSTKRNRFAGKRSHVTQGDVGALPFGDEIFNVVTAFETVYFWPDLKRSFSGIYRILKPGGRLLLCCEMSQPPRDEIIARIRGLRVYKADALIDFLGAAGFNKIQVHQGEGEWFAIVAEK